MKIALFTDTYFPQVSGVSTSIKLLKDELEKNGHEVTIFTTTDPDAKKDEENIVRILSIPFIFFKDRRMVIGGMYKALKVARQKQFDIVHTHTEFGLGFIGKFVANSLNIPIVHTYHTLYHRYLHYVANGHLLKEEHVKKLLRAYCQTVNGIIAPSNLTKETLEEYEIEKEIRIIPTGVKVPDINNDKKNNDITSEIRSIKEKLGIKKDEIVLLSLSRLSKEKNLDKLVSELPEVLNVNKKVKLVFVGEGPARSDLEKQVKDLNLTNKVSFVGEVENSKVNIYYQMADIYINASTSETQGLTYLESLVNQTPVIAAKNDYLSNIIISKNLGMLFDEEKTLSDCIIEYIELLKNNEVEFNQDEIKDLLYNISDTKFGLSVTKYYEDIIANYTKENSKNTENNSTKKEDKEENNNGILTKIKAPIKKPFTISKKALKVLSTQYTSTLESIEDIFKGFINKL